eukprot:TRINITY_DN34837_c0_g1_i1.p1 TRINITY_DN34837_c0_g1~~TRINITY_DN34837_c0_g1_i1.p1  ORF type:complete len:119 (+),score=27.53 TRINITY_DN34837_c0_g1_i1:45-401(+)
MSDEEQRTAQPSYLKELLPRIQSAAEQIGQDEGVTFTPGSIASLVTLTSLLGDTVSLDLKAFAAHAKRQHVNRDDVMLLARRNQHLKDHLTNIEGKKKKKQKKKSDTTGTTKRTKESN